MTAPNANSHLFVVLGGTGDLMRRKLLPSLVQLRSQRKLKAKFILLSVSRRQWDEDRYRQWCRDVIDEADLRSESSDEWCDECVYFQSSGEDETDGYERLASRIATIEEEHGLPGNRVLYLAIPPAAFPAAIQQLGAASLHESHGWTRLVVEKPFGRDLRSAQELNQVVRRHFDESQVYRIDHYLGKETVQNLVVFRFANTLFGSVWDRDHIANVQITVAESLGVEERAGYYDETGALRDMMQNHLTQLLTLIAMDAPPKFDADAVRDEKLRVLRSIDPIQVENTVFGQYDGGEIEGRRVPAYQELDGVPSGSATETHVAMKLSIDNWRWQGVPFYLRTGKRLPEKLTEIAIVFRKPPICLFQPLGECAVQSDVLRIRIQPDEAFSLSFDVKIPGDPLRLEQQSLEFRYADAYEEIPDAYHTLIDDIVVGDQTHFVRADEVEAAWRLYSPLLKEKPKPHPYTAGTWGPKEADQLLESEGTQWHTLPSDRQCMGPRQGNQTVRRRNRERFR